jgi:hypothetical protein
LRFQLPLDELLARASSLVCASSLPARHRLPIGMVCQSEFSATAVASPQ